MFDRKGVKFYSEHSENQDARGLYVARERRGRGCRTSTPWQWWRGGIPRACICARLQPSPIVYPRTSFVGFGIIRTGTWDRGISADYPPPYCLPFNRHFTTTSQPSYLFTLLPSYTGRPTVDCPGLNQPKANESFLRDGIDR